MRKTMNNLSNGRALNFKGNLHIIDNQLKEIHKSMMLQTFIVYKVKARNPMILVLNSFNAHHHFLN